MSNDNPFSANQPPQHQPPLPTSNPKSGTSTMVIVGVVLAVGLAFMMVCGGILVALMFPAVQAAREAARRTSCANNLKQIGLAMHNYHDVYGSLPPAYTVDEDGRPLHSWRTLILPFMEQQALYQKIDFSKPWDAPENRQISQTVVPTYHCPSTVTDPAMTTYVAVIDPRGIMSGPEPTVIRQVSDGLANTILLVETSPDHAVNWMSPDDIDLQRFLDRGATHQQGAHPGGTHLLIGDGAVKFLADSAAAPLREALVTKDGNEDLSGDF